MADLEKLAFKRDRGYLVRLVLMLALGVLASVYIWRGLTGDRVGDCAADAFLGSTPDPTGTGPAPPSD